ncbi:MAG TPA: aminotransferase class III-fold pyridoxal phosphate-dependent enzyme [Candidatus Nanopelagicales bacterium]|jgi:4-aminobutyrate aminotransferase-like enzyme/Ser/Thr protein kinase RdoA (MazF antagonist)/murein DD-endopeptidase MepM/ murein hydrolase activator NlpD
MTYPTPTSPGASELEQLTQVAQRMGAAGTVTVLAGEHDLNVRVGAHILKLYGSGVDVDVLDFQDGALRHLAGTAAASYVPQVVTSELVPTPGSGLDGPARLLTWLPGRMWADVADHTPASLRELGQVVARVDDALATFTHPAQRRHIWWNLMVAGELLDRLEFIADPQRRAIVEKVLVRHATEVAPRLQDLPAQVIHNDANNHNIVVADDGSVAGLIDFGDLVTAPRICGLAIACAYAAFDLPNPVRDVAPLVAGYHEVSPQTPEELSLLLDLMRARLSTTVLMASWQHHRQPDNDYLRLSEDDAWRVLAALDSESDALSLCRFRNACGYDPHPSSRPVRQWLHSQAGALAPVLSAALAELPRITLDWSTTAIDPPTTPDRVTDAMTAAGASVAIGRYSEDRAVYHTAAYEDPTGGDPRTVHLGVDLFAPAGTPVRSPLAGTVHLVGENPAPLDYGPVIVLEHVTGDGTPFFTLYGHLSRESLTGLTPGDVVQAGQQIATMGAQDVNGGWAPHVHLQLLVDLLDRGQDVAGVAPLGELGIWQSVSPDPNLVLQDPDGLLAPTPWSTDRIERTRRSTLSAALSLSYDEPLRMVRGWGAWLYDESGRGYLDLVNNVAHVGHSHPRVTAAMARQQSQLNTNTRYLHDALTRYARRLADSLPDPLSMVFLTNSGSEANDLALRLAYAHTGARDMFVLDHAYHGNLTSLIDLSPYKFDGPGGSGRPPLTHVVPLPDAYRVPDGPDASCYVDHLRRELAELAGAGRRPAALINEAVPGTAGQVVLLPGFVAGAYDAVREAGGLCIADEVQIGFGRVGTHRWGFELHGVVPDIVTLGKPIGNGHPLGAVVTTARIARSFANGMEYFNTFGGNPVSACVGSAVLDVLEDEGLQSHALRLGADLMKRLQDIGTRYPLVGDVRGHGLFLGVELVADRDTLAPAADAAHDVADGMRGRGVLVSTDGPFHNVLKIKPPLAITAQDAELFLSALDETLHEVQQRQER